MASRKLVRDFFLSKQQLLLRPPQLLQHQHQHQQVVTSRLGLISANRVSSFRRYSVLDEFSKKVKGEVQSNPELQKSIKDLKEKAGELKGVKEELKVRTKQRTEDLYKRVDGAWTEAEATAKKVSANVKEKISAATEEVKETLGLGKQESSGSTGSSAKSGFGFKDGECSPGGEKSETSKSSDTKESLFKWFTSKVSSASPNVSSSFHKLKDVKIIDYAKKGYSMVKDELNNSPGKRRRLQYEASSSSTGERSTRTDVVVVPIKQSRWAKKWEAIKEKLNGHRVVKKIRGYSEPVATKGQEIAEDVREIWETSDNPVIVKIQDLNDTIFGETNSALSFKEIRRRDPYFSLAEFVNEVEEMTRPTVNALLKGDVETLKKNCSPEVIERFLAERKAYEDQGIFFDNKLLHVSEVDIRETRLVGNTPTILIVFHTQQIHCVRDRQGSITEGGKDTIQSVVYLWAMQQLDVEEQGGGALYPVWRIREMHQAGRPALI